MTSRRRRIGSVGSLAVTSNVATNTASSVGVQTAVSPRGQQLSLSTSMDPSSPELSSPTSSLRRHRRSYSTGTPNSPQSLNASTDDDLSSWSSPSKKMNNNDGNTNTGATKDDGSVNTSSPPAASELNVANTNSTPEQAGLADARRRRRRIRNLHAQISSTTPVSHEGGDDEVSMGSLQTSGSAGTASSRSNGKGVPRGTASGFMRARAFRRTVALSTKPAATDPSKAKPIKAVTTPETVAQQSENVGTSTFVKIAATESVEDTITTKSTSDSQTPTVESREQTAESEEASTASRVLDKEARRRRRKDREETRSKLGITKISSRLSSGTSKWKDVLTDEECHQPSNSKSDGEDKKAEGVSNEAASDVVSKARVAMTDEEGSHQDSHETVRLTTIRNTQTDEESAKRVSKIAPSRPDVPTDEEGSAGNVTDFSRAARRRRRNLRKAKTSPQVSNGRVDTDDEVSAGKEVPTRSSGSSGATKSVKNTVAPEPLSNTVTKQSASRSALTASVSGRRGFISQSLSRQRRKQLLAGGQNVTKQTNKSKPPTTGGDLPSSPEVHVEKTTTGDATLKGYDTRSILDVPPDPPTDKEDTTQSDKSSLPEDDDASQEDCYVPVDHLDKMTTKKRRTTKKEEEMRRSRSRSRRSKRIARLEMSVSVEPHDRRHDPFVHGLPPKQYLSEDDVNGDDTESIRTISSVDSDARKDETSATMAPSVEHVGAKHGGSRGNGNRRKKGKEDKYVSPYLSASFTEGEEGGIPASASAETTKAGGTGTAVVDGALANRENEVRAISGEASDRTDEAWDLQAQPHQRNSMGLAKSSSSPSVGSLKGVGGDQKLGTMADDETKSETPSWACFSDTTICTNNRAFGRNNSLSTTPEGTENLHTDDNAKESSSDAQGGEKLVVRRWAQWAQAIQRNANDFTEEKDGDDEDESYTEDDEEEEESSDDEEYTSTEYTEDGDETDDVDDETDEQPEHTRKREDKKYRDDVGLLQASSSQNSTDDCTDDEQVRKDHLSQIERIRLYIGAGSKADRVSSSDDEETETDGDGHVDEDDEAESDTSGVAEETIRRTFKALEPTSDNDEDQDITEFYSTLGCSANPIADCSDDAPERMREVVQQLDRKANRSVVARDQIFPTFSDYNSEDDKRVAAPSVRGDVDAVLRLADMERSGARMEAKDNALADLGTFDDTDAGTTASRDSATIGTMATNENPAQSEPLQTAQMLSEVAAGAATMLASVLMSANETVSPRRPKPSPERPESPARLDNTISPRQEKERDPQDTNMGTSTADSPGRTSTAVSSLIGTGLVESGSSHAPNDIKHLSPGFPPPSPKRGVARQKLGSPPRIPETTTTAEQPMPRDADNFENKVSKLPLLPPPPEEKVKKWLHSKKHHLFAGYEFKDSLQKSLGDEKNNVEARDADRESLTFSDGYLAELVGIGSGKGVVVNTGSGREVDAQSSAVVTPDEKHTRSEDLKKDTHTEVTEKTSDDYPEESTPDENSAEVRSAVSGASSAKGSDENRVDAETPADMALLAALSSVKDKKQKCQENRPLLPLPRSPSSPSSQTSPPRYIGETRAVGGPQHDVSLNRMDMGETAKLLHGGDDITEFGVAENTDCRELAKALWKRNSLTKSHLAHDVQMISESGPTNFLVSPEKLRDLKGLSARPTARRWLSGNPSDDASPEATAAAEARILSDSRVAAKMASAAKKFEERYGKSSVRPTEFEASSFRNHFADDRAGRAAESESNEAFICSDPITFITSWNGAIKDKSQIPNDVCGGVLGATDCIDAVSRNVNDEDVCTNDIEAIDLQSATSEGRGRGLDLKGGAFSSWRNLDYAAPSDGASSACGSEEIEKKQATSEKLSQVNFAGTEQRVDPSEGLAKDSLQSSWVPGDPLTDADLYNWLLSDVLGPNCEIDVVQFLRASNTMPYERRLRYLVDNDEVVNKICQFVADRLNRNRMYGEAKEDCVSDVQSESGVSDFSFDTAADTSVLETAASNFWQKRRKLDAFVMQPKESSANILSANFVSFLSRVSHIVDKPSPFGKENPFILDIVSSSLPGSQVSQESDNKTMQNLVFGIESDMTTRVLTFFFEATTTNTNATVAALAGINEDASFDAGADGTRQERETTSSNNDGTNNDGTNNQEAAEMSSGSGNTTEGDPQTNSGEETTSSQINHNLTVPLNSPSPFEIGVWNEPSIVVIALAFLGDPVAVCRVKMINRFCNRIVAENEHNIMRSAVRVGGISMHIRPAFWMWITVEKCGREGDTFGDSIFSQSMKYKSSDECESPETVFTALERKGSEGKWRNVIQRDVSRAFGNMPPHKTGAKLRQDSIVRALVSYGRGRLIKRGVKGGGEVEPVPRIKSPGNGRYSGERRSSGGVPPWEIEGGMGDNSGEKQPETVSDWGGISPVGSTVSSSDGLEASHRERGRNRRSDKRRHDMNSNEVDELALGGNDLTHDMKADLQKKLGFILHALAAGHEEVGYCQGMDYVVAHLLRVLQDTILWKLVRGKLPASIVSRPRKELLEGLSESTLLAQSPKDQRQSLDTISKNSHVVEEVVFRTMDTFLTTYNLRHMYWPELRCLKTCCRVFERLIQRKLPVLADHFEHHELNVGLFALGWFQTLFLYLPSMPSATVCHMWDIWLVERSFKIFFRVGTAILFLSQPILLNHELEGMMTYLNTFPDATLLNPDILIACALQIKVTNRMLVEIEMEVTGEGSS